MHEDIITIDIKVSMQWICPGGKKCYNLEIVTLANFVDICYFPILPYLLQDITVTKDFAPSDSGTSCGQKFIMKVDLTQNSTCLQLQYRAHYTVVPKYYYRF